MADQIIKKLQDHDQQFETIARTVVDIQENVHEMKETMTTKADLSDISNTLDSLVGLAGKKDQELTFMGERVRRIEDEVKRLKPSSV